MMRMKFATLIACLTILANTAAAQTIDQIAEQATANNKSGSHTYSSGSSRLGAELTTSVVVAQSNSRAGIDGSFKIKARIFGAKFEALKVKTVSKVQNGISVNGVKLYTGGFAVYSRSQKSGWSWTPTNNQTWMEKNRSFYAGGFLLSAGTRVGGSVYGSLNMSANLVGAGVEGKVGSKVWADVTVGLDLIYYRAGIQAKATVMHGWWEADGVASYWGLSGEFGYHLQPLQIDLNLVIQKMKLKRKGYRLVRSWKDYKSLTLVTWTCNELKTIFLSW